MFANYKVKHPDKAQELLRRFERRIDISALEKLPTFNYLTDTPKATRQYSAACLTAVTPLLPELMRA